MSAPDLFVLDANVFIGAHKAYYGFPICPGFWDALIRQHSIKHVASVDRVKDELMALNDALSDWVKNRAPASFFKGTSDAKVIAAFSDMVGWVQSQPQFTAEAKAEFAGVADGWIVAYAMVNNLTVVTHEQYSPDVQRKVPIPNVCIEFSVDYRNTFEMLETLNEQFVLRHGGGKK